MNSDERVLLTRHGEIALLRIDNPPVNAVSAQVVEGLERAIDTVERDPGIEALVLSCAGRTFVAGGDITAFDDPSFSALPFNRVLARLEALDRPVVAALHGSVLGGGLELALACHWRVAPLGTRFGFPEVKLGLLPGSLGTQRLPRLVGIEQAFEMISTGRTMAAEAALASGIFDALLEAPIEPAAVAYARDLVARRAQPRRLSERNVTTNAEAFLDAAAAKATTTHAAYPAASAIVEALRAARLPFAQGEAVEARLFEALRTSSQSRALRHLFFAQRDAAKIPGLAKDVELRPIGTAGVLGAGTMGRGIAMNFLNAGIPTVLVEATQSALDAAVTAIRGAYEASASKGKLGRSELDARMQRLTGSLTDTAFAECDLVIEAVFEDLGLKQSVCRRLGEVCKPGAIIATNTSTLDVDVLARASGRPTEFIGLHFFSPAHVMRLLEVVRGAQTLPQVLATAMQLASRLGKVAVVSGVCYGFIGNRMAEVYMREAEFLLMEGATPAEVDAAVETLGMAMGPCRMLDMAGIDVGAKTVIEYGKIGGLPPDPSYRALVRRLFELGRFGQKTGAGYYRYEGRTALPDPETACISTDTAAMHGIAPRQGISAEEIVERLLYPMINEAARILEDGIAYRPGDIDVVWTAGYGFPDHRGGPLFLADEIGLGKIVARLAHYAAERGDAYGYWTPSKLLTDLAAAGRRITDWRAGS